MKKDELNLSESSDFHYLLELMPPLYNEPAFAWLPELFSIIGHEKLIQLCKYAGGEKMRVPTLTELSDAIDALEWYYTVFILKKKKVTEIPANLHKLVNDISKVYDARDN